MTRVLTEDVPAEITRAAEAAVIAARDGLGRAVLPGLVIYVDGRGGLHPPSAVSTMTLAQVRATRPGALRDAVLASSGEVVVVIALAGGVRWVVGHTLEGP